MTNKNFKSYLAGLIEGDGSFIAPKTPRDSKGRLRYAKIKVAFHVNDKPLFELLQNHLGGVFEYKPNYGVWIINKNKDLKHICNLINGYLRTPKVNDFYKLVDYLNFKKKNVSIKKLKLDSSSIDSNAWLAGFTDADGNFNLNISNRKTGLKKKRVQIQFRLEIKRFYSKKDDLPKNINNEYFDFFPICDQIACFIGAVIYVRSRPTKNYGLIICCANINSRTKCLEYFDKFPLFSSKYLNFLDWKTIHKLQLEKRHLTSEGIKICETIQRRFNNNRKTFCWNHLKNFYI